MLFFCELIGKRVITEHKNELGILRDVLFLNEDTPRITKIVVSKNPHHVQEVAISALRKINNHIVINHRQNASGTHNELSVQKVLLDQQIIDLVGNKVVRANDVVIQDVPNLTISGIDIGIMGVFRRIGVESSIQKISQLFHITIPQQFLSWGDVSNLDLDYGQIKIKQREEKLAKIHEEDLADYLEMTNIHNVHKFIGTLTPKKAAQVLQSLTVTYQLEVFQKFDSAKGAELILLIDPDAAVDILLAIDRAKRDKIMYLLPPKKRQELHHLMTFSRTPVGKIMTSEYLAVRPQENVRDIIQHIKSETVDYSFLSPVYVINKDDQLVGVFNLHEMLLQNLDIPAYKFMVPDPVRVLLTTPIEIVVYKLLKYNISALPVINRDKKILGIITIDDVSELLLKNNS